jgi:hypothetical protein
LRGIRGAGLHETNSRARCVEHRGGTEKVAHEGKSTIPDLQDAFCC